MTAHEPPKVGSPETDSTGAYVIPEPPRHHGEKTTPGAIYGYVSEAYADYWKARADAAEQENAKLLQANRDNTMWCEAALAERDALQAKLAEAERQVRIAAGMISTMPGFSDKHPEVALKAIQDAAIDAERQK